ncbi:MAG: hypothetical protein IJ060_02570 [Oscillospiraceae bacterium]|nr:hypothetical protein [Oscillospiraceae bacterium]
MNDIKVTVTEQPGKLGSMKASALAAFFVQFYADHKDEVDRKVEELRKKREVVSCPSGSMPQDTP